MTPTRLRLACGKSFDLQAHSLATNGLTAVNVTRPSRWGNRWRAEPILGGWRCIDEQGVKIFVGNEAAARQLAVSRYRAWIGERSDGEMQILRGELRGRNLACWCPLPEAGQPDCCHAAVLLDVANVSQPAPTHPEGSWRFSCVECGWEDYAIAEPEECPRCGALDLDRMPARPGSGQAISL